jgi:hypothetical protein
MSSTKIVIVVLILIAVVFALFVTKGALSDDPPKPKGKAEEKRAAKEYKAPDWSGTIGGLFSSMQPALDLGRDRFSAGEFEVESDEERPFRVATFRLVRGSVNIDYEDQTEEAEDLDLDDQEFTLPDDEAREPREGSIVALKRGGTLTISCNGTDPCEIEVKK